MKRKVADKLRHQVWTAQHCKHLALKAPEAPTVSPVDKPTVSAAQLQEDRKVLAGIADTAAGLPDVSPPSADYLDNPTDCSVPVAAPTEVEPVRGRTQYVAILDDANFYTTPQEAQLAQAILATAVPPPAVGPTSPERAFDPVVVETPLVDAARAVLAHEIAAVREVPVVLPVLSAGAAETDVLALQQDIERRISESMMVPAALLQKNEPLDPPADPLPPAPVESPPVAEQPWDSEEHPDSEFEPIPTAPTIPVVIPPGVAEPKQEG